MHQEHLWHHDFFQHVWLTLTPEFVSYPNLWKIFCEFCISTLFKYDADARIHLGLGCENEDLVMMTHIDGRHRMDSDDGKRNIENFFTKSNKHWSWTVSDKVSNFGGSEIGIFIITCMNRHTEMIMFLIIESASEWWTWSSAASSTHVSSWMRISWVQESDGKNLLMVVQWHCGTCLFPLSDGLI